MVPGIVRGDRLKLISRYAQKDPGQSCSPSILGYSCIRVPFRGCDRWWPKLPRSDPAPNVSPGPRLVPPRAGLVSVHSSLPSTQDRSKVKLGLETEVIQHRLSCAVSLPEHTTAIAVSSMVAAKLTDF